MNNTRQPSTEGMYYVLTLETERTAAATVAEAVRSRYNLEPVTLAPRRTGSAWIEAYFTDETEALLAREASRDLPLRSAAIRPCAPRDWQDAWKIHFKRRVIGRRLVVCPPWEQGQPAAAERIEIVIEPGLSFGTGDHFTTRFCLEQIDALCRPHAPESLLDLGAGSGILAIAAARLGCRRVRALEKDPSAVQQARENAVLNRVARRIRFECRDITRPWRCRAPFTVVCANLSSGLLCRAAGVIAASTGQTLLLSGILEPEADRVAAAFQARGWEECLRDGDGEWAGLRLRRAAGPKGGRGS